MPNKENKKNEEKISHMPLSTAIRGFYEKNTQTIENAVFLIWRLI